MTEKKIKEIILFFLAVIIFFLLFNQIQKLIEIKKSKVCLEKFNNNDYYNSALCYNSLYKKYKNIVFKYNEANSWFLGNNFENAKKDCDFILKKEKKNKEIISETNSILEKINQQEITQAQLNRAENLNIDNYFKDLKDYAIWKNPQNLKVYYDLNEQKNYIFKEAFEKWNDTFKNIIHFEYTDDKNSANITCQFVDSIKENDKSIGMTYSKFITYSDNPNVKYFSNADIHILKNNPITKEEFSDNKILATTMHEIGHALGINTHSPNKKDIMYEDDSSYENIRSSLSYRDVNTIRLLYHGLFK